MEDTLSNDSLASQPAKDIPVLQSPASYHQQQRKDAARAKENRPGPKLRNVSAPKKSDAILIELQRGAPTDDSRLKMASAKTHGQKELSRQRNKYYHEAFGLREPYHSSRNRVNQDSIIVVEIKTNLELEDAPKVISDMTFNFAQILQRPESSMMIVLDDSTLLRFGATAEPAYLMKVSALSQMIAPMMNMRHTALMQAAMAEILDIPKDRGVIKFESISEENFATNGSTIKDEIQQLDRASHEDTGLIKTLSQSMTRKNKSSVKKPSTPVEQIHSSPLAQTQKVQIDSGSRANGASRTSPTAPDAEKRIKKYKSLAKLFSH
ncbi:hypothetical protein LOZ12_005073 [Ophidiomyces ophidiicola]|uniref:Uncharacterized protein n=1 Tax=Ophidiomyces ophidiicola TaxID=1387563 RepID=A0ACB8UP03_9EURO|nr:hypothetical protein LOZ64_005429 [Ophidiomyces ophidiicola]KAI1938208.1 hypothetical protein LOZ62_005328 [Ophidiomyces ophidiicola]KAI1966385.1 hypothetical protein LOZ56_005766 [Ophidiomyces ophidiicola]KAI2001995.1 hypothetical protein LOZ50_005258 [Ophidiomyces ophidiicola]KAI2014783.1 hypothetical protein LOZ46_005397 [Ophidiomyces ophidiicola]